MWEPALKITRSETKFAALGVDVGGHNISHLYSNKKPSVLAEMSKCLLTDLFGNNKTC